MNKPKILRLAIVLLVVLSNLTAANGDPTAELNELNNGLRIIAGALAVLMMSIAGLKYVISSSPQEREDAKKGIIYILVGLTVVVIAGTLVATFYCEIINTQYGVGADCSSYIV